MKTIFKKLVLLALIITNVFIGDYVFAEPQINENGAFQENRFVDRGTFNEQRLLILKEFIDISNYYESNSEIPADGLLNLSKLVKEAFYYLPDTLKNESLRKKFISKIQAAQKKPGSDTAREELVDALKGYIETDFEIESVAGEILATPIKGHAPLNVTLEGNAIDGNGTLIDDSNYTWWIKVGGKRKVIGVGKSINYTFNKKGIYRVFLDIVSSSKNSYNNTDVLPYSGSIKINVGSKLANISINVSGEKLNNKSKLKFIPDQAMYGLIFDASGSIPAKSTEFIKTYWNFGNGLEKKYDGRPKPERVVYTREGVYNVIFQVKTNKGDLITRTFDVEVRDPIATIKTDREEGFIGDKFNFMAKTSGDPDKLIYSWKVIDILTGRTIGEKQGKVFSYEFEKMGSYTVVLDVKTTYSNESNIDVQYININSRKPEPIFNVKIANKSTPNTIELNATKTFDPDFVDNLDLKYTWYIDGKKIRLKDANDNNSFGYYKFDSIGTKSINLKVEDSSGEVGELKKTIDINSILFVDFEANPRAIKRGETISFRAYAPNAKTYKWDFGDGKKYEGKDKVVSHKYEKSNTYKVKLVVGDDIGTNSFSKEVFVGDGRFPVAILDVSVDGSSTPELQKNLCGGNDAYIFNRHDKIKFDLSNSIDVDGGTGKLKYTFKIEGNYDKKSSSKMYQFSEIGCYEVIGSVKSGIKGTTDKTSVWVNIINAKPTLGRVGLNVLSEDEDSLTIEASAMGAGDVDGAVLSYLWYYYTSTDSTEQDIRRTYTSKTKFVLPKIRGDYYFVVVLTDNDGAIFSSDNVENKNGYHEIIGGNNNANVPIINLNANKTNFYLGEEVIITAKVDNVLGKSLTDKIDTFYWDFDGDGFYDLETKDNKVTHKFKKVGKFYTEVKVKNRGYTSTKNITMVVSNKLNADFSYISIGNKFIFINRSTGNYDNLSWDLGDGDKISNKNVLIHDYKGGKQSHLVNLKLSGGGEIKKKGKKVVKNMKNLITSKKSGIHAFTSPSLEKDGTTLILNDETDVYVYFGTNEASVDKYTIDFDINFNSDVEGTKADDEDALSESIKAMKIDLNSNKIQTIRLGHKDSYGVLLEKYDIKIIKNYITEEKQEQNQEKIYEGINERDKKIIEDLKSSVSSYPENERKIAMEYISKLQEEWRDGFERTKLIYEFDEYLDGLNTDTLETHDILLSIFSDGNDEGNKLDTWYNALVGLIPNNIECGEIDSEYANCRAYMVHQIGEIKNVKSEEEANNIGVELLDIIKNVDKEVLSNKNKIDFKAVLKEYISEITGELNDYTPPVEQIEDTDGIPYLKYFIYLVGGILGIFILGGIGFFVYFKIVNKDGSKKLEDFILDKTKNKSDNDDILSSFGEEDKKEENKNDISKNINPINDTKKIENKEKNINKTEQKDKNDKKDKKVPSWLAGTGGFSDTTTNKDSFEIKKSNSFGDDDKKKQDVKNDKKDQNSIKIDNNKVIDENKKIDTKKSNNKTVDESKVPDWLKGSFDDVVSKKETTDKNMDYEKKKVNDIKKDKQLNINNDKIVRNTNNKNILENTKVKDNQNSLDKKNETKSKINKENTSTNEIDTKIPDWLKGSIDNDKSISKNKNKDELTSKDELINKDINNLDIDNDTNTNIDKVPDWLKSDIKEDKINKSTDKKEVSEEKKKGVKVDKEKIVNNKEKKEEDINKIENSKIEKKGEIEKKKTANSITKKVEDIKINKQDNINKDNINKDNINKDNINKDKDNIISEKIENKDEKLLKNTNNKKVINKNINNIKNNNNDDESILLNDSDGKTDDELWDNGMDVPDWLKTDDK